MDTQISTGVKRTTWYVCWQAATGRSFAADPNLIGKIRERLKHAHRSEGRALLFYLVTHTEIHLLSRFAADDSPRELVRQVAPMVARWVREADKIVGPVFAAPYRAREIRTDAELRSEIRMLAWRPVEAGLSVAPLHYVDSSLRITLGQQRARGFASLALLEVFQGTVLEARGAMRRLIRQRPSKAEISEWEFNHGLAVAVGSAGASFGLAREVSGGAAALVAAATPQTIDGALHLLERWVALRLGLRLEASLSSAVGIEAARARALVAGIAVQSRLCPAAAVARHFDRARSTLSEQMKATRLVDADRLLLATPMRLILDEVLALRPTSRRPR